MRSTRLTALALSFGVGCLGAYGAEAALAQDRPAPQREADESDRALRELEQLLEELLGRPNAKPAPKREPQSKSRPVQPRRADPFDELLRQLRRELTPEQQARRAKEMENARRDFERRMADMDRRFAEMRKRMEEDLKRMFGGESPFGPGGLFGRGGGRPFVPQAPGRGKGNSSRTFSFGRDGRMEVTLSEGDERIKGKKGPDGVFIEVTKPGTDGKPQTTEYRAKNKADFDKKYPGQRELWDRTFGRGSGLFVEFGPFTNRKRTTPAKPAPAPKPLRKPSVTSTKLGFTADRLSGLLATQLRIPAGQGLYVRSITPGGWAERAGLEPKDIILSVGGKPVGGIDGLEQVISGHTNGDESITLVLQRQGVRLELGVPK